MPRPIPDLRTTEEVETSRDMVNRKPYRTAEQKDVARQHAQKKNGTWVSYTPRTVREF